MMHVLICAVLLAQGMPSSDATTDDPTRFFETSVRPMLIEHCHKCHGPDKQWAGLRLDSRNAILKGGDSGPAVVPGNPEESLLIRAIRHVDENLKMPEDGQLTGNQISNLVRWVELGAPYPDSIPVKVPIRDPAYWIFLPPGEQAVPDISDQSWPRTEIDHFILAGLEARMLSPAAPADRLTLIRRVTYDVTGLPPTAEEVLAFVADDSPDSYARLVDRLLDSPAYGERWGRHWLDVARYADSNGLDENVAHGNAWRYRDYVVSSFNQNKPFNRFIVEQLAGDLLPFDGDSQRHEQLTATGFLSIGPKVLAEVDQTKMRMDIVDEQIDTVGRVFIGLTLGCARCHDHKFDPIDTADYYGLAGIFKSTRTMDTYTKVAKWHEHLLPSAEAAAIQADFDATLMNKRKAIDAFVAEANAKARSELAADQSPPENLESLFPESTKAELAKLREELSEQEAAGPELPSVMGVTEDDVADVAVHVRGDPLKLGKVIPRHTPPVILGASPPEFTSAASGRHELANWLVDPSHPLTARVFVNRVWRWHFGRGLVRTTDNFGLLGEQPTHPELLDWLALRFIADDWSLKSLHRLILNSRTFQQSSIPDLETLKGDPENLLFGRANVRRLSAEEVRDSLLAVSGQLDTAVGGPVLKVKNRGYLFDHTSIDLTDYNSVRRSLYLPVIRNNVFDLFQLLDFPDPAVPTGDRATSTVAPQALMILNSDFVMQSADKLAERLMTLPGPTDQRLSALVRMAYCRDATEEEIRSHEQFLMQVETVLSRSEHDPMVRNKQAWNALCHTILAANEFIYVK